MIGDDDLESYINELTLGNISEDFHHIEKEMEQKVIISNLQQRVTSLEMQMEQLWNMRRQETINTIFNFKSVSNEYLTDNELASASYSDESVLGSNLQEIKKPIRYTKDELVRIGTEVSPKSFSIPLMNIKSMTKFEFPSSEESSCSIIQEKWNSSKDNESHSSPPKGGASAPKRTVVLVNNQEKKMEITFPTNNSGRKQLNSNGNNTAKKKLSSTSSDCPKTEMSFGLVVQHPPDDTNEPSRMRKLAQRKSFQMDR